MGAIRPTFSPTFQIRRLISMIFINDMSTLLLLLSSHLNLTSPHPSISTFVSSYLVHVSASEPRVHPNPPNEFVRSLIPRLPLPPSLRSLPSLQRPRVYRSPGGRFRACVSDAGLQALATVADGDARASLNLLEMVWALALAQARTAADNRRASRGQGESSTTRWWCI